MAVGMMKVAASSAMLAVIAACRPVEQPIVGHQLTVDPIGLERVSSDDPTIVLRRPGAPTLAAYDRFIVDPVRVDYSDPGIAELSDADVARLQTTFRDAVVEELRDGGYAVTTRSAPNTLRMTFTISGFKASSVGSAANIATQVAGVATKLPLGLVAIGVGAVRIEGVFREATSNRVDAIVVSEAKGSRVLNPTPWSTWADVEAAFDQWAEGIREAIDEAHGRS